MIKKEVIIKDGEIKINGKSKGEDTKEVKKAEDLKKDDEVKKVLSEDEKKEQEKSAFEKMPEKVEDSANVFKMVMLENQIVALDNKRRYLELNYNVQLETIRKKMAVELRDLDAALKDLRAQHKNQKDYIESTHSIALKSYNYNDETGVLTKQQM